MRARLLKRRCHTLLRGLYARLASIDTTEYPTDAAPSTRNLLQRYLEHIEQKLETTNDPSLLFLATELLDSLDYEIGYLELATTSNTPRTLSLIIEDLKARIGLDGLFFVAPNAERNYMVENIATNLTRTTYYYLDENERDQIFGRPSQPIYIVSFPRTGRDDVLTHGGVPFFL